jgi:multicomponent Na+:H+ antiporter subunit D
MDTVTSIRPLLALLICAFAAMAILIFGKSDKSNKSNNLRDAISLLAAAANFLVIASMAPVVLDGRIIECHLFTVLPGIGFSLRVDPLGMVFASISSLLWIVAAIYSIGYMRKLQEHHQTRFFSCFAISIMAAIGGAFAANLFTLVIFYELLSLITYPLVYHKETEESWLGSKKYLVYLMGASKTFLLAAIALTYSIAGTLDFAPAGLFHDVAASPLLLTVVYACYLAGFAKAAIMPFHAWLPAAMVAPTPVSALLHAVAVVKMGVFCVLRVIFHVFGVNLMDNLQLGIATAYVVSFTILMASIYALTRDDLKARLAYSTVSQLSYIILGAVLLAPSSIVGGVFHIASHAFAKITLFFCAGSIYCASRRKNISELSGIGRYLPWTMTAFFIGSLSMIGIPPTGGFISKWYLIIGTVEAKQLAFLVVLLLSSVLNAIYFLPISYKAFFEAEEKPPDGSNSSTTQQLPADQDIKEIPLVTIPLMITAVLSLLLGVYPHYFLSLAQRLIP